MKYDVIVAGVGAMGSASVYSLAKRGLNVLGLEQFALGHDRGSSNGQRRIVRRAYFEKDDYIPLLNAAYPLWDDLGDQMGKALFHRVGLCVFGEKGNSKLADRIQAAGKTYSIPLEVLSAKDAASRYPFEIPESFHGVLEPEAGYADVEATLAALQHLAKMEGATLKGQEGMTSWTNTKHGIEVTTVNGQYLCDQLVLSTGGWSSRFLQSETPTLKPKRTPQMWFDAPEKYEKVPCFAFDLPEDFYYGFPSQKGMGVKLAAYKPIDDVSDPSTVDQKIPERSKKEIGGIIDRFLPGVSRQHSHEKMCFYTLTPDEHFLVGIHPKEKNVIVAGGCSGHMFKFTPVIGEIVADLALHGKTPHPIGFLGFERFAR